MSDQLQAFLDQGTSFEGKISFSGAVRIDGHFQGDITAEGMLVVGETGRVEANMQVGALVVQGTVVGDVTARERIEIGAAGDVEGSVQTPILKVEDGARLVAKVAMREPVPTLVKGTAPPAPKPVEHELEDPSTRNGSD